MLLPDSFGGAHASRTFYLKSAHLKSAHLKSAPRGVGAAGPSTDTVLEPSLLTYIKCVVGSTATPSGSAPTGTVATVLVAVLMTETLFERAFVT